MNIPVVYTAMLTVFILFVFGLEDNVIILVSSIIVGVALKLLFTITSKTKKVVSEIFTMIVDILLGIGVVYFAGLTVEIVVLSLSVLYLLYYSYAMTISYTRLGHTTEEMLRDLTHRHEHQNKQNKKR